MQPFTNSNVRQGNGRTRDAINYRSFHRYRRTPGIRMRRPREKGEQCEHAQKKCCNTGPLESAIHHLALSGDDCRDLQSIQEWRASELFPRRGRHANFDRPMDSFTKRRLAKAK